MLESLKEGNLTVSHSTLSPHLIVVFYFLEHYNDREIQEVHEHEKKHQNYQLMLRIQ